MPSSSSRQRPGRRQRRCVGKPVAGEGWRVWDTTLKRGWGNLFDDYPTALLDELNGEGSPPRLTELAPRSRAPKARAKKR